MKKFYTLFLHFYVQKTACEKLFGWIILNYHISILLCQIFSVYSAAKSNLVKILVKIHKFSAPV